MPTDMRNVADLRPHPKNGEIYGDRADADLVESIRQKGMLNPILVTTDGRIISGHRRWDAARRLNIATVPVVEFGSTDELDIVEALVESNRQREKTGEQVGREYSTLKWVYHERESRQGQRLATIATSDKSLSEVHMHPTRQAARQIGVSQPTATKAEAVVGVVDMLRNSGKQREAEQLRTTLNTASVSKAYEAAKEAGYITPTPKPAPATDSGEIITLARWHQLSPEAQAGVLLRPRSKTARLNSQDDNNIEWALWSWNPVTGCLHNCTYCYARDIAERFYPQKFVPTFLPERLDAPRNTPIPAEAAKNVGARNIFTCSMADLFGRWVPTEWIEAVLDVVRANQQWNFLFLTKFPTRLAEFTFPDNAWVGTTVDAQARVETAERAFRKVRAVVKWLSCEPLLEPLVFTDLALFDWIVIGGASRSTETPEFRPPREWIEAVEGQARQAGCRVYEKANLLQRIREYPGQADATPLDVGRMFRVPYLQRDLVTPTEYQREMAR